MGRAESIGVLHLRCPRGTGSGPLRPLLHRPALEPPPLPPDIDTPLCGACLKSLPPWDEAKSPLAYAYPLDKLIQRFKFQGDLATGRLLGELLADYLAAGGDGKPDLLIPVPLHASRLKERGFNQAIELARPVAKRLRVKMAIDVC